MQTPPIPENLKKTIININGEICKPEDAKISVFDRGFLFGDSVYEVAQTYQGIPFLLQEHLDRLWKSASRLEMLLTVSQNDVSAEVNKALAELGVEEAYFRIILTRGEGPISLDPGEGVKNNLIIIAQEHLPFPSSWYENGVHVVITNVVRVSKESVDPNVKSGNYLNNVMAFMQAKREKAFDSIMLNHKGYVTQGTTSNVWIVKDNTIKTPPLQAGILEGITRKT
ncbi:MAG: aminotransferase class IV, partial [Bdellovibrionota bacterium]|nr:aminotransferase class IV [Bdellovibrionota bacterium]